MRLRIGAKALKLSGVRRLHIIGCARSGTTFLQYCLLSYKNTLVENTETSPHHPDFRWKLELARRALTLGQLFYVTKRTFGWFEDKKITELLDAVDLYGLGVILVVRDPRAVLTSHHRRAKNDGRPYVDEERWYRSTIAGETIWKQLRGYPFKCVIKYEDVISDPNTVNDRLCSTFGLQPRDDIESINAIRTNTHRLGYAISKHQRDAMHGLQDADPSRLTRPLQEVTVESAIARQKFEEYVHRYDNNDDFTWLTKE